MPALRRLIVSYALLTAYLLGVSGCVADGGRVAVVLDNSGSMTQTGTPFEEIKETLLHALYMLPSSHEVGLRVFWDNRSKLVAEYAKNFEGLRAALPQIEPKSGTYIGKSLLDVADDLIKKPQGTPQFIFITDGEGTPGDIQDAEEARKLLQPLSGTFACHFILFSARQNVRFETPIGKIADILGCDMVIPGPRPTASTLAAALQRIISRAFYPLWLILSLLAYITLLVLTAHLFFAAQYAQKVLPRQARWKALMFFVIMLPVVVGTHMIGLLGWSSTFEWFLVILAWVILVIGFLGVGTAFLRPPLREREDDPFTYSRKRR